MDDTKPAIEWQETTLRAFRFHQAAHGRVMTVSVVEKEDGWWLCIAIELPADADVRAALDDHAHVYLGEWKHVRTAKKRGERYAAQWAAERAAEPCTCGPMFPPPR